MNTDQFDVSMIYTLGSVSLIVGWLWRASTSFHVEAPQSELTINDVANLTSQINATAITNGTDCSVWGTGGDHL